VIKKTIKLDFPIESQFLEIVAGIFRNYPHRLKVNELSRLAEAEGLPEKIKLAIRLISDEAIKCLLSNELFLAGLSFLSVQPEFFQSDRFVNLLKAVENGAIVSFLAENYYNLSGLVVRIGSENPSQFSDCSFVTTGFSLEREPFGVVGLLGPVRMDYPRATSVVRFASRKLSEALSAWFN
jgi:transcriptional regulator of heat shock response